jgi:menaquinone-specific isochorismate synthase
MSIVTTTTLVALTRAVDPATVDLLSIAGADGFLWERDGNGLAARGLATRVTLPAGLADATSRAAVADRLVAIEADDAVGTPGCGPIAIGALPFSPTEPASLVIPALIAARTADGAAWVTTIGAPDDPPVPWPVAGATGEGAPDAFSLTPSMSHDQWCALVADGVADIRRGALDKVVLAREVMVRANRDIDVPSVLARLAALYPSCVVFSIEGFIGASPELLVRRSGASVASHPLAGTIPRSGDPAADEVLGTALLNSVKERAEHRFVVDDVALALGPLCSRLEVPDGPSIVPLRNVSHLGTRVSGTLAGPADSRPTALDLAARLHPTAAVAGTPRAAALDWLAQREGFARGPYAGPVGWVDARGDGEWMVGIRSAVIDGATARLFAGVGVVADSDPAAELAETQLKLQALLAAVVRP